MTTLPHRVSGRQRRSTARGPIRSNWIGLFAVFATCGDAIGKIDAADVDPPIISLDRSRSTVLLLALQEGAAGEAAALEWSEFLDAANSELPPLWVLCSEGISSAATRRVEESPHLIPLTVEDDFSWPITLDKIQQQVSMNCHPLMRSRCSVVRERIRTSSPPVIRYLRVGQTETVSASHESRRSAMPP